jgi:tetratricopeptide (TPR) repeat protein
LETAFQIPLELDQWRASDGADLVACMLFCAYGCVGLWDTARRHLPSASELTPSAPKGKREARPRTISDRDGTSITAALLRTSQAMASAVQEGWPHLQGLDALKACRDETGRLFEEDESVNRVLRSFIESLVGLCVADMMQSAGDLRGALNTFRGLALSCQGRATSGGREEVPIAARTSSGSDGRASLAASGAQPSPAWPPHLGGWKSSWCLAECVLRIAELWELQGVAEKVQHYHDKAVALSARGGSGLLHRRCLVAKARTALRCGDMDACAELLAEAETSAEAAARVTVDDVLAQAQLLITKGDLQRKRGEGSAAAESYARADDLLGGILQTPQSRTGRGKGTANPQGEEDCNSFPTMRARAKWRRGRVAWEEQRDVQEAQRLFQEALAIRGASAVEKAHASHELGAVLLRCEASPGSCRVAEAWPHLWRALLYCKDARAPQLYRRICRSFSLAPSLCKCPLPCFETPPADVAALVVNASIGTAFWNIPRKSEDAASESASSPGHLWDSPWGRGVGEDALDSPMTWKSCQAGIVQDMRRLTEALPPGLVVCTLALDEHKRHLLLTRVVRDQAATSVVVPLRRAIGDGPKDIEGILEEFQEIMEGNRQTLRGHTAEEVAGWGQEEQAAWWKQVRRVFGCKLGPF